MQADVAASVSFRTSVLPLPGFVASATASLMGCDQLTDRPDVGRQEEQTRGPDGEVHRSVPELQRVGPGQPVAHGHRPGRRCCQEPALQEPCGGSAGQERWKGYSVIIKRCPRPTPTRFCDAASCGSTSGRKESHHTKYCAVHTLRGWGGQEAGGLEQQVMRLKQAHGSSGHDSTCALATAPCSGLPVAATAAACSRGGQVQTASPLPPERLPEPG